MSDNQDRPHTPLPTGESIVDKIYRDRQEKERQEAVVIENAEEWQQVANRIFSSDDGKLFAKYLIKQAGIFKVDKSENPATLLANNGKKSCYLELVRPFLTPAVRLDIENQN